MINNENINQRGKYNRFIFVLLFIILLIIVSIIFISIGNAMLDDNMVMGLIIISFGFLVLTIGGIYIRMYNQKSLQNIAVEDELSTFQLYKTGYYSFVGSMYIMVFMIVLLDVISQAKYVVYIGLALNFLVFIILYPIIKRQDFS